MRLFDGPWLLAGVAEAMRRRAVDAGFYDGRLTPSNAALLRRCSAVHMSTGTRLLCTRDVGMHSSGWWKNPDYERCWHLSLSFHDPLTGEAAPKNAALTSRWLDAFYREACRYVWAEPPFTADGKARGVWHYRLFCDPGWVPLLPRGEVYGRELTEAGWRSFSEVQAAERDAERERAHEVGDG